MFYVDHFEPSSIVTDKEFSLENYQCHLAPYLIDFIDVFQQAVSSLSLGKLPCDTGHQACSPLQVQARLVW